MDGDRLRARIGEFRSASTCQSRNRQNADPADASYTHTRYSFATRIPGRDVLLSDRYQHGPRRPVVAICASDFIRTGGKGARAVRPMDPIVVDLALHFSRGEADGLLRERAPVPPP